MRARHFRIGRLAALLLVHPIAMFEVTFVIAELFSETLVVALYYLSCASGMCSQESINH